MVLGKYVLFITCLIAGLALHSNAFTATPRGGPCRTPTNHLLSWRDGRLGSHIVTCPSKKTGEDKEGTQEVETSELTRSAMEYSSQIVEYAKSWKAENLKAEAQDITDAFIDNAKGGTVGERGEQWVLLNAALVLLILVGDIPLLEGPLNFAAGPGLLLAGALTALAGIRDLGTNLSPWATDAADNTLTTAGAYALVRHPIYTGELLGALGLANLTGDASRYLLAAALFWCLDQKASEEEAALAARHPAYKVYKDEVPKFFPNFLSSVNNKKEEKSRADDDE
mmetsp:Transcript_17569/g.27705  ORF Transcript_17569/g.27705 Transcript_17569/m.27705 type:complete len:282 (+) Transcript_17569:78-923(+)|eukprot:CAMPEP_0194570082 /NCGR_PEP_ID=MMETSP0292-20121207/7538_1 /TAXON_ID=39354 /ORGANISM="Heterosigma akashiwo, Strain CCMP2393" /LENGTH=281 /DNA_ID=CAMNT_0039420457 /DNA_START=64 /DNA_END=909 /DNA_ORIENTATION=-